MRKQQSKEPTRGPERSKNVLRPVVEDLTELFGAGKEWDKQIEALWMELKKLQIPQAAEGTDLPTDDGIWVWVVTSGTGAWVLYEETAIDTCDGTITVITEA